MQLTFSDEQSKTAFLARLENVKNAISAKQQRAIIDNVDLIESLLDQVSEQVSSNQHHQSTEEDVPKTTKPMLK